MSRRPNIEALRLYRDILRRSRSFYWPNDKGEPWNKVLQESARKEFEQAAQELARKIRKDVRCPVAKAHARCVRSPAARGPCALPVLGGAPPEPQCPLLEGGCDALRPRSL